MTRASAVPLHDDSQPFSPTHLIVTAVVLGCLSYSATCLNANLWGLSSISILWPSTGLLMAIVLTRPRKQWAAYIAIGFAVDFLINVTPPLRESLPIALYLSSCNAVEVTLSALLLGPRLGRRPDLAEPKQLGLFILVAVILSPTIASALASFAVGGVFQAPTLSTFGGWLTGDALGTAIVAPLYLAWMRRPRAMNTNRWLETVLLLAILCTLSGIVFWQTSFPGLFLILPLLLLLEMRVGMSASALGILLISAIGGYFTSLGLGPIGLSHLDGYSQRTLFLQFFIAVCMCMVYILEIVLAQRDRFDFSLRASEQRFRVLAEGSQDLIVLRALDDKREYVSPSVRQLLGWTPEEFLALSDEDTFHPDDLPSVRNLFRQCLSGAESNVLAYRARRKDGSYLWMEANMTLHRSAVNREPIGFINVVRDISARKEEERRLNSALRRASSLATTDALTGVANRRSFDEFLSREWRRGERKQTPVSLLLMDVDYFKVYNDRYGHLAGDNCLKEVAETIARLVLRPTDLLARYGGEEFAVILPGTDAEAALTFAEHIRTTLLARQIPHARTPDHVVTLSVGCATLVPQPSITSTKLIEHADYALYLAKADGRNCVRTAKPAGS